MNDDRTSEGFSEWGIAYLLGTEGPGEIGCREKRALKAHSIKSIGWKPWEIYKILYYF